MRLMGIDEAGRGSVLGPLVLCGWTCEDGAIPTLRASGVTDSKLLSPVRRRALVEPLLRLGRAELRAIDPSAIDAGNVNDLELEAMVAVIDALRPDRCFIDTPVAPRGIPRFERTLRARLSCAPELVIEPKADRNHLPVSAASVLAKVRRDAEVERLGPVGSGYPSDPVTRAHVAALLASGDPLPAYVRARWGTVRELRQQSLFGG